MDATIHIIDDDADTRDALAWLFDSRGHTTTAWPDGESFLIYARALPAWPLAVAVMDIRMEPVSGLATLEKPFQNNNLVDRVEAALEQATLAAERDAEAIQFRRAILQLSQREREVLEELLLGHYNKVIAEHLGITPRTVEFHRANIFQKMGVSSAVELAHKRGLFRPDR